MDTGTLLLVTAIKILIVVIVVVGLYAPGLVWAERRQSAMIQDRVGPHRAGITLPASVVDVVRMLIPALTLGMVACFAAFVLSVFQPGLAKIGVDPAAIGITPSLTVLFGVGTLLLALGAALHKGLVAAGGTIRLLGVLHPLADALKMIFKEDFQPPKADAFLFQLAPIITLMPAIAVFAAIPFGGVVHLDHLFEVLPATGLVSGPSTVLQIAPLDVGILFVFAIAGTGIIGAAIGGYASDNKYSLMGGLRAASQMVSYEVVVGLTLVPAFMIFGSLRLDEIGLAQTESHWGIVYPPMWLALILYLSASIAETKRIPFDMPEGESELVGGYFTEYSGMKFGIFMMSEFVEVVSLSALCAILFFGGWDVPFLDRGGFDLPGTWSVAFPGTAIVISDLIPMTHIAVIATQVVVFFFVKVLGIVWLQLMIRWTLPRFRYDQVMSLCWKGLLPLALANILFTGVFVLLFLD